MIKYMQPNSPTPTPGAYDFITNNAPQQQTSALPQLPKGNKKLLLLGGAGLFVIILVFGALAIFSGNDPTQEQIASIAARQQEIVRISTIAVKDARSSDTLVYASTVKATVQSQQNRLLAVVKTKPDNKVLASKRSETTEKRLEAARQSNRFDEAYIEYITKELTTYQNELRALNDLVELKRTKTVISDSFSSNGLILKSLR